MATPGLSALAQSFVPHTPVPASGMASGMAPFDPTNPLTALSMMQAMTAMISGLAPPNPFGQVQPPGFGSSPAPATYRGQRCRDYDTKGFCLRGVSCPYEHGDAAATNTPFLTTPAASSPGFTPTVKHQRAAFSDHRPKSGPVWKTIVVEPIPDENYTEESVRDFFSAFGEIEEVVLLARQRLAIIKYATHEAADAAYQSPKAIFDNRFVKVYWYNPETQPHIASTSAKRDSATRTETIDPEQLEAYKKQQAEKQKSHEERLAKWRLAQAQQRAVEQKLKDQEEERKKLMEALKKAKAASNGATKQVTPVAAGRTEDLDPKAKAHAALKAKLAELQAEAEAMGIDPEDPNADQQAHYPSPYSPYRGRGRGYRGSRGGFNPYATAFAPRGRGYPPAFSIPRGRGQGRGTGPAASRVKRLDNRPKRVEVKGVAPGTPQDEALRGYLFQSATFADAKIDEHPDRKESQIITFPERWQAEEFMAKAGIPGLGKVEREWVPNAPMTSATTGGEPEVGTQEATQFIGVDKGSDEDPDRMEDVKEDYKEDEWDAVDEEGWMG